MPNRVRDERSISVVWCQSSCSVYSAAMRIHAPIWLLVLCLAWQGIAFAGAGGRWSSPGDADHERMHRENLPHHHGVDGKIAPDDSMSSLLHALADVGSTASIVSVASIALPSAAPVAPVMLVAVVPTAPCLDGPTRPPRPIV